MGFFDAFDKIDDIIYKPIEAVCEWIKAPLKSFGDNRSARIEKERARQDAKLRKEAREHKAEIENNKRRLEVELQTKRETDKVRILAEIEEIKKDKELARMKKVSDAIMEYQRELTKLNVVAITEIGNMQLDLRERMQNMIIEKTREYKELQKEAKKEAMAEYKYIVDNFNDQPEIKENLMNNVNDSIAAIINNSRLFLEGLAADLQSVNKSIDLLAHSGQKFIEGHLQQFQLVGFTDDQIKQLVASDESSLE